MTLHPLTREETADYPRCDSDGCWCRRGPRVNASTGQAYTVEELPRDGARRVFRYLYLGAA